MAINFPAFPASGDTYSYGGFTYIYDGEKWTTTSAGGYTPIALACGFIGAVEWYNGFRDKIPTGYVAADGQLLDRIAHPELWAEVEAGKFATVTDALWLDSGEASAYPQKAYYRANYSTGDEATTFRVPDLNGIQENSVHALFLRGAGNTGQPGLSPGGSGTVRASAAPNITGTVITRPTVNNAGSDANMVLDAYGALETRITDSEGTIAYKLDTAAPLKQEQFSIDASLSHDVFGRDGTEEVRPASATGIWIIRSSAIFATSGDFVESTGDTMTGNLWVELEDTAAEPHIGVIRDTRQLYLYDSGTAYGLRTLNPDASNIILISRNAATDDVFVGDGAAAVHIDNPSSASPQGMGIASLTRKDYVDSMATSNNLKSTVSIIPDGSSVLSYFMDNPTAMFRNAGAAVTGTPEGWSYGTLCFQLHGTSGGRAHHGSLMAISLQGELFFNALNTGAWVGWKKVTATVVATETSVENTEVVAPAARDVYAELDALRLEIEALKVQISAT